jgi:hypothetical protein
MESRQNYLMLRKLTNDSNFAKNFNDGANKALISPKLAAGSIGAIMKADQSAILLNDPTFDNESIEDVQGI